MATHSSVLAWRIPGTGVPDGLPSMGWTRLKRLSSSSIVLDLKSCFFSELSYTSVIILLVITQ